MEIRYSSLFYIQCTLWMPCLIRRLLRATFTLELEGMWPMEFRISSFPSGQSRDYPISLHTRAWEPQRSRNGWTNLHGILHGMQWIMLCDLPDCASSPPKRGGSNTKPRDHDTSNSHHNYGVEGSRYVAFGWEPSKYVFTVHLKASHSPKFNIMVHATTFGRVSKAFTISWA